MPTTFKPNNPLPSSGTHVNPPTSPTVQPDKVEHARLDSADVVGRGDAVNGVYGGSKKQTGVVGDSETLIGVTGFGPLAGVTGNATSDKGDGVVGTGWRGVVGRSNDFQGVFGKSVANAGVVGESDRFHGVYAVCHAPAGGGLYGTNDRGGFGVMGVSDTGIGVFGKGGTLAARFEGDVEVTGDIRLSNADCAEDFDIAGAQLHEPGSVMVVGEDGRLEPCAVAYDRRVAGVISGAGDYRPAVVLDRRPGARPRQPVALLGKVCCWVDAGHGSVAVGDPLTTSTTPGHAMKASDAQQAFGAVIGKALAPLAAGRALVPTLVALQ